MLTGSMYWINLALAVGGVGMLWKAVYSEAAAGWVVAAAFVFVLAYENAHPYSCNTMNGTCVLDADNSGE